jgi:hypothetical protein
MLFSIKMMDWNTILVLVSLVHDKEDHYCYYGI